MEALFEKGEPILSPEVVKERLKLTEAVLLEINKLGSLRKIKEALKRAEFLVSKKNNEDLDVISMRLQAEYKTDVMEVKKLLETLGEEGTVKHLKLVSEEMKKQIKNEELDSQKTNVNTINEKTEGTFCGSWMRSGKNNNKNSNIV
jgi:hypothetical protein